MAQKKKKPEERKSKEKGFCWSACIFGLVGIQNTETRTDDAIVHMLLMLPLNGKWLAVRSGIFVLLRLIQIQMDE